MARTHLGQLRANIFTKGEHKSNHDHEPTSTFTWLHRTTQKTLTPYEGCTSKFKSEVLKQMHFDV
jgi:hypothetical protein